MKEGNKCNVLFKRVNKKELTIHRLENEKSNNKSYKSQIDKLFNDPKYFFSSSINGKEIVIGKRLSNITFHNHIPLIPIRGKKNNYLKKNTTSYKILSPKITSSKKNNTSFSQTLNNLPSNQKYIDNEELDEIYDNFRKKAIYKNKSNNSVFHHSRKVKSDLELKMQLQEKALKKFNIQNKSRNKIIKKILEITNKDEKNILINSSDNYRIKKEFITQLEEENEKKKQKPLYNWQTTLRFNENDKEKNENYFINVGLKYPNWQLVKNTIYKRENNEYIRNPSLDYSILNDNIGKGFKNLFKNGIIKKIPNRNIQKRNFFKLSIKGESLLSFESNNSKLLKGRKILHLSELEPEEKKSYLITELNNNKNIK